MNPYPEYSKRYYENHKESILKNKKDYYKKHRKDIKNYSKKYYNEHKIERQKYARKYGRENKEHKKRYKKNWIIDNPEKNRKSHKKNWNKRKRDLGYIELFGNHYPDEIKIDYHHINNLVIIPMPKVTHIKAYHSDREEHRERANFWLYYIYGTDFDNLMRG